MTSPVPIHIEQLIYTIFLDSIPIDFRLRLHKWIPKNIRIWLTKWRILWLVFNINLTDCQQALVIAFVVLAGLTNIESFLRWTGIKLTTLTYCTTRLHSPLTFSIPLNSWHDSRLKTQEVDGKFYSVLGIWSCRLVMKQISGGPRKSGDTFDF